MRFDAMNTKTHLQLADEICATADEPDCVMHGPVLREHKTKDLMIEKSRQVASTAATILTISFYRYSAARWSRTKIASSCPIACVKISFVGTI